MTARNLSFNTFDEAIAEIDRLHAGGYHKAGNWGLGQMCEHLSIDMEQIMQGKTFSVPLPLRLIGPLFKKSFFKSRKMRAGLKAPASLSPHDTSDEGLEANRMIAAMRKFSGFPGPFPRNPIFGQLTTDEWCDLQLIHIAHHLGYLIPNQAVAAAKQSA